VGLPNDLAGHPRYRIVRLLGEGGMGAVYLAEHRLMDRLVALKIIRPQFTAKATSVARFHREVKTAAQLDHPHIVRALDAETAGNLHFLVMEYVHGRSLGALVRRDGPLPIAAACEYIRQAALGLQYAHERNMVHRDIKPDNLMRTEHPDTGEPGGVKILDFGLARLMQAQGSSTNDVPNARSLTQADALMGTPEYLSPEQASNATTVDGRADIYALGCTLYHLLAGHPPFTGDTAFDVIYQQVHVPPPSLRKKRPDVPAGLERLVFRMMAKEPGQRYPTPAAVAQALTPYARARRSPWLQGVLIGLLGVLGVLLGTGLALWRMPPAAPVEPPSPLPPPTPVVSARAVVAPTVPLDRWKRTDLLPNQRTRWPAEVVAVWGTPSGLPLSGIGRYPAYSRDGKWLAASSGFDVRIFASDTGQLRATLPGQVVAEVQSLLFSADGQQVFVGTQNGTIYVWDWEAGKLVHTLNGHTSLVFALALAPDGKLISTDLDRSLRVWNLATGQELAKHQLVGGGFSLAFHLTKPWLAVGYNGAGMVQVLEWPTCKELRQIPLPNHGFTRGVFSPDGRFLLAANEAQTQLWDANNWELRWEQPGSGAGLLSFSPDGQTTLAGGLRYPANVPGQVVRRRVDTGADIGQFAVDRTESWAHAVLRPDGAQVAWVNINDHRVRLFAPTTGIEQFPSVGHQNAITALVATPDGTRLATGDANGLILIWDTATGKICHRLPGTTGVRSLALRADGQQLAAGYADAVVRCWTLTTGALLHQLSPPAGDGERAAETVDYHPSGELLAVSVSGTIPRVQVWDLQLKRIVRFKDGTSGVFHPNGEQLALITAPNEVSVVQVQSDESIVLPKSTHSLWGVTWNAAAKELTARSATGAIERWSWPAMQVLPILNGHTDGVSRTVWDATGRWLATSGADGTVRWWEPAKHPGRAHIWALGTTEANKWVQVAFSPEGRHLFVGTGSGQVLVVRLAGPGQEWTWLGKN
jgi:serine/threonine protein kinase/WD40 repeat protein